MAENNHIKTVALVGVSHLCISITYKVPLTN